MFGVAATCSFWKNWPMSTMARYLLRFGFDCGLQFGQRSAGGLQASDRIVERPALG